jgi:hypothetical protein
MCSVTCPEVGFIMFSFASQCARHLVRQPRHVRPVDRPRRTGRRQAGDAVEEFAETRAPLFEAAGPG